MVTPRNPTLSDVIRIALDARDERLRVAMPGEIKSYDATKQSAQVQPLLKCAFLDADGARQVESLPLLNNVPIVFPGGGGFRLTFPVKAGDVVLLVFADQSLDRWKSRGGDVDPGETRPHDLSNAIAIAGLHDLAHAWTGASSDSLTIGNDGGMQIEIRADQIKLNAGSTPVAKEGSVTTGHVHTVVGTAGPFPIVLTPTPGFSGSSTDTIATGAGSSTVKVP